MEKCSCCSVRTACLVLVYQISNNCKEMFTYVEQSDYKHEEAVQELFDLSIKELNLDSTKDEIRNFFVIAFCFSITDLILSILMIVAATCLIYGVQKKSFNFLLPALSVCPFDMFMRIIFVFIHSITLGFFHPISLARNVRLCCGIIFDTLLWLCIFSCLKQANDQDSQQGLQMDNEVQTAHVPKY